MKSKNASYLIVGLLTCVLLGSAGFAYIMGQQVTVLKLAHSLDQKHPVHQAMVFMAERAKEKSGGDVIIEIFPNSQLGSETECIELLIQGALAMTKTSTASMENFIPEIALYGVPYVFRDEEHFWRVIHSDVGEELLTAGEKMGLRGLCYYDAGARSFYTVKTPINQPSDLKGLKIRVQQSKTAMEMVEALGGNPTPISFGELFTSLQQSIVEGAENNTPSFYNTRHFEVCKHYSLDEHTRVPDMLLMSEKIWERLTPQEQQWVQEAADESAEYQRKIWAEECDRLLKAIEAEGVTVHHPDQAAFAKQVEPMHRSYDGTKVGELMARIKEL